MFGEIGAWYYKALGGIKPDPAQPGFKNILLQPHFVEGLDRLEANHQGPYGQILSAWERIEGKIVYTVIVPPNSTATLKLPVMGKLKLYINDRELINPKQGLGHKLLSGTYHFEWK